MIETKANSDNGFALEVYLQYGKVRNDRSNIFPFYPENRKVPVSKYTEDMKMKKPEDFHSGKKFFSKRIIINNISFRNFFFLRERR